MTEVFTLQELRYHNIGTMGGHAAWRKRVAAGLPSKGAGGAILRHRPHLGRKGKDLIKNRKGNIAGGNPKKKKKSRRSVEADDGDNVTAAIEIETKTTMADPRPSFLFLWTATTIIVGVIVFYLVTQNKPLLNSRLTV